MRQHDIVAVLIGLTAWFRYLATGRQEAGAEYWVLLFGAAAILGWLEPRRGFQVGGLLVAPQMVLAVWTAPRGDGDGLWILVFPMLVYLGGALGLAACAASWLRRRASRRR